MLANYFIHRYASFEIAYFKNVLFISQSCIFYAEAVSDHVNLSVSTQASIENISVEGEVEKRRRSNNFPIFHELSFAFSPDMFQNALVIFAYFPAACSMIAKAKSLAGI